MELTLSDLLNAYCLTNSLISRISSYSRQISCSIDLEIVHTLIHENEYVCKDVNTIICSYIDIKELCLIMDIRLGKYVHLPICTHKEQITPDVCEEFIMRGGNLCEVPRELRTLHICNLAIEFSSSTSFVHVPQEYISFDLCKKAFQTNGLLLLHLKKDFSEIEMYELYKICLNNNGLVIQHIAYYFLTTELCYIAIRQTPSAIKFVPAPLLTQDMCKEVVSADYSCLKHIPSEYKKYELCYNAILRDGLLLHYVPWDIISYDMCINALKNNYMTFPNIPKKFRNDYVYECVLGKNGKYLNHIDAHAITPKLAELAIQTTPSALRFVPKSITLNGSTYLKAIKENGTFLQYIDDKNITKKMAKVAVQTHAHALVFVPRRITLDENTYLRAVREDGTLLKYVHTQTQTICDHAVYNSAIMFKLVKDEFKTKEMCDIVVERYPDMIHYIPLHLQTKKQFIIIMNKYMYERMNVFSNKILDECIDLYLEKVKINNKMLESLKYQPEKLCLAAVSHDIHKLRLIHTPSESVCMKAISLNPYALQYVQKPTIEMYKEALSRDGRVIKYIKRPTFEQCIIAINQNIHSIIHLHWEFRTYMLALEVFKINPNYLIKFPRYVKKMVLEKNDL